MTLTLCCLTVSDSDVQKTTFIWVLTCPTSAVPLQDVRPLLDHIRSILYAPYWLHRVSQRYSCHKNAVYILSKFFGLFCLQVFRRPWELRLIGMPLFIEHDRCAHQRHDQCHLRTMWIWGVRWAFVKWYWTDWIFETESNVVRLKLLLWIGRIRPWCRIEINGELFDSKDPLKLW